MDAQEAIKETVTSNPVVLYMKGSPKFPQCGFSNLATQILDACEAKYVAIDVLQDQDIRERSDEVQEAGFSGKNSHSRHRGSWHPLYGLGD